MNALAFSASTWYRNSMKARIIAGLTFLVLLAASCATGPVEIPENMTPMELIQKAQEASDMNRYAVSLQYYQAIIDRFPYDIDSICAAEYEIAFIHYKQKKYDTARERFNGLLERYDIPDAELLPQQFRILANIVLKRIDELESGRKGAASKS